MTARIGGGGGSDALARKRDFSDVARIPEQRDRGRGSASTRARRLWEALGQARNGQQPLTQARLEEAAFGFYLPRARALADQVAVGDTDRGARRRAAELGLARAVLGWQPEDPEGFERFCARPLPPSSGIPNAGAGRITQGAPPRVTGSAPPDQTNSRPGGRSRERG
jgi:hypothetical protein